MKKSLFSLLCASAAFLMACGDDSGNGSSEASLAERCAPPKLSMSCLEGSWTLAKIVNASGEEIGDAQTQVGGELLFDLADTTFVYTTGSVDNSFNAGGVWGLSSDGTALAPLDFRVDATGARDFSSVPAELTDTNTLVLSISAFELYVNPLDKKAAVKEVFVRK